MNPILEGLNEVIQRNLPAQTAGELKKRLDQIDELEAKNTVLTAENAKAQKRIKEQEEELMKLRSDNQQLILRQEKVAEREKAVLNKELEAQSLKLEAEKHKEVREAVMSVVNSVFRNVEIQRSVTRNANVPVAVPQGGFVNSSFHSETMTEQYKES